MSKTHKFSKIKTSIEAGLANMGKWYRKTDASRAYFISLALNPSYKLAYFEDKWDVEWLFERYYTMHSTKESGPSTPSVVLPPVAPGASRYGKSWMISTVLACQQQEQAKHNPQQELKEYLNSPLVIDLEDSQLICWWGHHTTQYPILSKMA
ncbi:hypothetical protein JAAARDRAFT_188512 [Jaapia argillacea MUCL 33604]|uniref:HAT C-terminal dimerisation domain-containing protein n=1 Tax=Jaapia argillacea MUCL 33604 TaxID=933084 RepID=A0A067Q7A9_9AGAM|nr:hypothetical protein JAAARDRAFT_188512 [Jaapia argillacea MUCL 33604]